MKSKIILFITTFLLLSLISACDFIDGSSSDSLDEYEEHAVLCTLNLLNLLLFPETIIIYEILVHEYTASGGDNWRSIYIDYAAETRGGGRNRSIQKYVINLDKGEMLNHNQVYAALSSARRDSDSVSVDDLIRQDYQDAKSSNESKKLNADKILKIAQDLF